MTGGSLLVRVLGHTAMLIHGDTLVYDRWRWLKRRLPAASGNERLIDIGCGSGAFTVGAAKRRYHALGLTWDDSERAKASGRAAMVGAGAARFETYDVRALAARDDLAAAFDVALCFENIEHVLDDRRLMIDIAGVLAPGGRLFLTTPNFDFRPITDEDLGPISTVEDGGHVRRGYRPDDLNDLCRTAGLTPEEISYCSGFLSQKITALLRRMGAVNYLAGWVLILPFRLLPPLLDGIIARITGWPGYSICLVACKPGNEATGDGA